VANLPNLRKSGGAAVPASDSASPALERLLGIVTEVRTGEATTVLLLTLISFLVLLAYAFIKPVIALFSLLFEFRGPNSR
jgi:hypothetical protein